MKSFNPAVFTYKTKDEGMLKLINELLSSYKSNPDLSSLDEQGKAYYKRSQELHKEFNDLLSDPRWKFCEKGEKWTSDNMDLEGYVCLKTVGFVPLTPIDVHFTLS